MFPIDLERPEQLAELVGEIESARDGNAGGFDVVVTIAPDEDPAPWAEAGATWVLNGFGPQPREADVRAAIAAGPR